MTVQVEIDTKGRLIVCPQNETELFAFNHWLAKAAAERDSADKPERIFAGMIGVNLGSVRGHESMRGADIPLPSYTPDA